MENKKEPSGRNEKGHFTTGNTFWEIRSSNTRGQIFESPEKMWESACGYFAWCEANPEAKAEQNKQSGKPYMDEEGQLKTQSPLLAIPVKRLITLEGLSLYLHVNTHYFNDFMDRNKKKKEPENWEKLTEEERDLVNRYTDVIRAIRDTIGNHQLSGAAEGFFQPNIVARKLGLTDKIEQKVSGEITQITGMIIK